MAPGHGPWLSGRASSWHAEGSGFGPWQHLPLKGPQTFLCLRPGRVAAFQGRQGWPWLTWGLTWEEWE